MAGFRIRLPVIWILDSCSWIPDSKSWTAGSRAKNHFLDCLCWITLNGRRQENIHSISLVIVHSQNNARNWWFEMARRKFLRAGHTPRGKGFSRGSEGSLLSLLLFIKRQILEKSQIFTQPNPWIKKRNKECEFINNRDVD